jgi:hypothetical protein
MTEATIDDFIRLFKQARLDEHGYPAREIIRVTLHPADFSALRKHCDFADYKTVQVPPQAPRSSLVQGDLWGTEVRVDARGEKGIAYVVAKNLDRPGEPLIGSLIPIVQPPEPVRRTSWARVLDDDDLGVELQHG